MTDDKDYSLFGRPVTFAVWYSAVLVVLLAACLALDGLVRLAWWILR